MNFNPYLTGYIKINLRLIMDLNIKYKASRKKKKPIYLKHRIRQTFLR